MGPALTMSDLRTRVIRLAHQNPQLRPHLLPLLKQAGGPLTWWLEGAYTYEVENDPGVMTSLVVRKGSEWIPYERGSRGYAKVYGARAGRTPAEAVQAHAERDAFPLGGGLEVKVLSARKKPLPGARAVAQAVAEGDGEAEFFEVTYTSTSTEKLEVWSDNNSFFIKDSMGRELARGETLEKTLENNPGSKRRLRNVKFTPARHPRPARRP